MQSADKSQKINLILDSVFPPLVGGITTFTQNYLDSELSNVYNIIPVGYNVKSKNALHFFLRELAVVFRLINQLIFGKSRIIQINSSAYVSFYRYSMHTLVAKLFRKYIVLRIGGSNFDRFVEDSNSFAKRYIKFILHLADSVVVLTSYWQLFFQQLGIETTIIPNAISHDFDTDQDRDELRKKYGVPVDSYVGIFLGTIEHRKGILDLVEVAYSLQDEKPGIQLLILGRGPLYKELATETEEHKNIKFLGEIEGESKYEYLYLSDFLIFPSYAEGFPNAIVEAMSVGLPVVASDIPPVLDIVKHKVNGIIFNKSDTSSLKNAVEYCYNHKEDCEQMGRNNRSLVKADFHWDTIWEKYDEIYKDLLKA